MVRIISVGEDNALKSLWRKFNALDLFTRLLVITLILLAIAISSTIYNYQLFNARGESEAQRLQTIQQLQNSQENLKNIFARSSTTPVASALKTNATANSTGGFNLLDAIYNLFARIAQIFK